jgi:hypothetical protein
MDVFDSICRSISKLSNAERALKANKRHLSIQHDKLADVEKLVKKYKYQTACNEEEMVEHINKLKNLYSNHKEIFNPSQLKEVLRWVEPEPNAPDDS